MANTYETCMHCSCYVFSSEEGKPGVCVRMLLDRPVWPESTCEEWDGLHGWLPFSDPPVEEDVAP
jgi:hypothetical protein